MHVVIIATSYDTLFEPVKEQARARASDLVRHFGDDDRISELSFIIKNDAPPSRAFTDEAQRGLFGGAPQKVKRGAFVVEPLFGGKARPWGRRGLAYLEGMSSALSRGAAVVVTINLNRKVEVSDIKRAFDRLLDTNADVVVGTRDRGAGGVAIGAGKLGSAKSWLWKKMAARALPSIARFSDPNAPVKIMRRAAAQYLVANSREADVCPDIEWLALWLRAGFVVEESAITWTQRRGSRPPWTQVPRMLLDLGRLRRRLVSNGTREHG